MSSELNLPPFYVGQKVVALVTKTIEGVTLLKGSIHTVKGLMQCKCGSWKVDIGFRAGRFAYNECYACGSLYNDCSNIMFVRNTNLSPIEENFQSISLEKVLEEETTLISVN